MASNVFGALNRFISRLDSDPNIPGGRHGNPQSTATSATTGCGFQVLRNTNASLNLEPWFDYIIGINGHSIENPDPGLFITELRNCTPGSNISLGVYGAKGRIIREVYVSIPESKTELGLALQWTPLSLVDDCCWHILDVMPNSPADLAGLLPYSDYVLGSPDVVDLRGGDAGLGDIVERFMDRPLRLFVYNQEYDVMRTVTITPARNWGGEGALGCVLGFGALHRIPAPLTEPAQAPGETLFDTASPEEGSRPIYPVPSQAQPDGISQAADFLVPANMQIPTTSPPPPSGKPRKARAHVVSPSARGGGLDDYFAEGEQKSRELDNAPKAKASSLPPPPKAGGGPPPSKAATAEAAPEQEAS